MLSRDRNHEDDLDRRKQELLKEEEPESVDLRAKRLARAIFQMSPKPRKKEA